MRYSEAIIVAALFAAAAYHKAAEMIDTSTILGVIASLGAGTVAGLYVVFAGITLTLLSNKMGRS